MRTVKKDERKYYEALVQNSIKRLMLFPYHLADMIVKGEHKTRNIARVARCDKKINCTRLNKNYMKNHENDLKKRANKFFINVFSICYHWINKKTHNSHFKPLTYIICYMHILAPDIWQSLLQRSFLHIISAAVI